MSLFPEITFHTILAKDGISNEEVASLFSDLLIDILEEINSTYDYRYTRTALNVVVSTPDRRVDDGTYNITVDGVIYYFDEVPTTETLAHSFNVYFSLWGPPNLEDYLLSNGFEEAFVISVDIGGESIDFYDKGHFDGRQNIFINQDGKLSKLNIMGFYVLFVVIAVAIVLIVYRIRLGRRRQLKRGEITTQRGSSESTTSSSREQNDEESGSASSSTQVDSNDDDVGTNSIHQTQQSTTREESTAAASKKFPFSDESSGSRKIGEIQSQVRTTIKKDDEEVSPPSSTKSEKKSSKKKRKGKKPKKSKKSKENDETGKSEASKMTEKDDKAEADELD